VQVQVMTSHGTTGTSTASAFSYGAPPATRPVVSAVSPDHGPVGGGTKITINGIGLDHGSVSVDGHAATSVSCTTSTCTANTPAGAAGPADVIVTTSGGTTSTSSADQFIYQSPAARPPSVASLIPSSGSTSGGTTVTIHGTNLSGGIVSFGQFRASATCTATKCTATSPPGGVGQVDVAVLASGGLSATRSADLFTYKSS
jgi:hypothetical protein